MQKHTWERNTRWIAQIRWLLVLTLGVPGCGPTGDEQAPDTQSDSGQGVDARGRDTTTDAVSLATNGVLQMALDQLLRGQAPSAAEQTWFSSATAGALRSVRVDSVGHAIVDFEDLRSLLPNASSSAGSEMLLRELNATVFGVSAVRSVDYRIEGRCELFWEWLQRSCQIVHRPV